MKQRQPLRGVSGNRLDQLPFFTQKSKAWSRHNRPMDTIDLWIRSFCFRMLQDFSRRC